MRLRSKGIRSGVAQVDLRLRALHLSFSLAATFVALLMWGGNQQEWPGALLPVTVLALGLVVLVQALYTPETIRPGLWIWIAVCVLAFGFGFLAMGTWTASVAWSVSAAILVRVIGWTASNYLLNHDNPQGKTALGILHGAAVLSFFVVCGFLVALRWQKAIYPVQIAAVSLLPLLMLSYGLLYVLHGKDKDRSPEKQRQRLAIAFALAAGGALPVLYMLLQWRANPWLIALEAAMFLSACYGVYQCRRAPARRASALYGEKLSGLGLITGFVMLVGLLAWALGLYVATGAFTMQVGTILLAAAADGYILYLLMSVPGGGGIPMVRVPLDNGGQEHRVAYVVVHGMAQQKRYETRDAFAAGFAALAEEARGGMDTLQRAEAPTEEGRPMGAPRQVESLNELLASDPEDAQGLRVNLPDNRVIHCYEIYWAPLAQGANSWKDTLVWVGRSLIGVLTGVLRIGYETPDPQTRRDVVKKGITMFLYLGAAGALLIWVGSMAWSFYVKALIQFIGPQTSSLTKETAEAVACLPQAGQPAFGCAVKVTQALLAEMQGWTGIFEPSRAKAFGLVLLVGALMLQLGRHTAGLFSAILVLGGAHAAPQRGPRLVSQQNKVATLYRFLMQVAELSYYVILVPALYMWLSQPEREVLLPFALALALVIFAVTLVRVFLSDFFGDVPTYVNFDEFSKNYDRRVAIQKKGLKVLKAALTQYDSVILVGHSLGSVIAKDLVRQVYLCHREDLFPKLRALVTIGSPLRKVRSILEQKDSYTGVDHLVSQDERIFCPAPDWLRPASAGTDEELDEQDKGKLPWYNFWILTDLFADPLRDKFPITYELEVPWGLRNLHWSHSDYWYARLFYEGLVDMVDHHPTDAKAGLEHRSDKASGE